MQVISRVCLAMGFSWSLVLSSLHHDLVLLPSTPASFSTYLWMLTHSVLARNKVCCAILRSVQDVRVAVPYILCILGLTRTFHKQPIQRDIIEP